MNMLYNSAMAVCSLTEGILGIARDFCKVFFSYNPAWSPLYALAQSRIWLTNLKEISQFESTFDFHAWLYVFSVHFG
jgi:hypothetical protein